MFTGKLYLLNTSIIPNTGFYAVKKITVAHAKSLIRAYSGIDMLESAIGHEASAKVLSKILDYPVKMNRVEITMKNYDRALVLKLKKRLPEGVVLETIEEIEEIGFELWEIFKFC